MCGEAQREKWSKVCGAEEEAVPGSDVGDGRNHSLPSPPPPPPPFIQLITATPQICCLHTLTRASLLSLPLLIEKARILPTLAVAAVRLNYLGTYAVEEVCRA